MGVEILQIFKIQNLIYYYPERAYRALDDITLSIDEGEFVFLAGRSGCGKSTLLKTMAGLLPDFYGGRIGGSIRYRDRELREWDKSKLPWEIGMVFQDPETQVCMTVVEHEVVFGMENLGVPLNEMRQRAAESMAMLNLTTIKDRSIFEISGGQKQKVVLAGVLAMHPKVLILDEPTSQLDPIAANEILDYIYRLNREWGITVILSEQRIERCFDMADRMLVMDGGSIVFDGTPRSAVAWHDDRLKYFMPPVSNIFRGANMDSIPINIKEGREIIKKMPSVKCKPSISNEKPNIRGDILVEGKRVNYAYPDGDFSVKDLNFTFHSVEVSAIFGENGTGKTTLLKLISGILKPKRGSIRTYGDVGYISQNPNDYLFSNTVYDQLLFALDLKGIKDDGRIDEMLKKLHIYKYRDVNPRDLSSGERQRVAIGTVMVSNPSIVVMDEPTRGMDGIVKEALCSIIDDFVEDGKGVIMVTHDMEFAAKIATRAIIMADGSIVADGEIHDILGSSFYYSTQTARLFRDISPDAITADEGISVLRQIDAKGRI